MLNSKNNSEEAAQTRVSARDLTEALAAIEIRKARLDYEQAGTVTLAEAAAGCGIDAAPSELWAEIDRLRAAEAAQEKIKNRQRRLRLALGAEIVSAALCLLALLGMKQTVFNPVWQKSSQDSAFRQKLALATGSSPQYEIDVVPEDSRGIGSSQTVVTTFGHWADLPAYPLHSLPDGCNIHHFEGLEDDPTDAMSLAFGHGGGYVEFREPQQPFFRDNVSVYYNGLQYWRGAIRRKDIPSLLHGGFFTLYPALVLRPPYQLPDAVPLTVSLQSIEAAHGKQLQATPECYNEVIFLAGNQVALDKHAWEQYAVLSGR